MTKPIARDPIYCNSGFDAEITELCVRWCITTRLSYCDLVEMIAERGVQVGVDLLGRLSASRCSRPDFPSC